MFHQYCCQFLEYYQLADFSVRSIKALTSRFNELTIFLKIQRIRSFKRVRYRHLIDFTADYNNPSFNVTKSGGLGSQATFSQSAFMLLCTPGMGVN